jgi:uncharacterized protein involved in exopolysaccharide biosynthesis
MTSHSDVDRDLRMMTLRDLIAPIFRHKLAGFLTALTLFTGTTAMVLRSPKQYEAEMKILVKRERVDAIVSGDSKAFSQGRSDVTEDELNSEVELLKSRDLLEQVALAAGLYAADDGGSAGPASDDRIVISETLQALQRNLKVTPLKKTTLISVSYRSSDPTRAARVLRELARLYLEKHLSLRRPPGTHQFFSEQAARFREELTAAEARWQEYGRQEHVVSAEVEKESTLQTLANFEAALQQARGGLADSNRRIAELEAQIAAEPPRQTTQIRTSENTDLIGRLKSRILDLEVKQAEMLRKFTPTYPPVVEIEQELAQAHAALERTQKAPLTEETTDQNPTHQWLRSELARVKTDRASAVARTAALADSVRVYREKARELDEKSATQQDLKRTMKSAEENYLLYARKQEEARISDALDHTRIANVTVADAPTVPALPVNRGKTLILMLGAMMAVVLGIGVTYVLDYLSPYLRTPTEVERALDIPVLASLPARHRSGLFSGR